MLREQLIITDVLHPGTQLKFQISAWSTIQNIQLNLTTRRTCLVQTHHRYRQTSPRRSTSEY